MEKRLFRLFCDQVEAVVRNQPPNSFQSLLALLSIANPQLSIIDLHDKSQCDSTFKRLQSLIHPDKYVSVFGDFPDELSRVTHLFQDTCEFYYRCCYHLKDSIHISGNSRAFQREDNPTTPASTKISASQVYPRTNPEGALIACSQESLRAIYEANHNSGSNNDSLVEQHLLACPHEMWSMSPSKSTSTTSTAITTPTSNDDNKGAKMISITAVTNTAQNKNPMPATEQQQASPSLVHQHIKEQLCGTPFGVREAYARSGKLPITLDAFQVWPFLVTHDSQDDIGVNTMITQSKLAWCIACRCLNARGAIVHGQGLGQEYFQVPHNNNLLDQYQSVEEVFQHWGVVGQSHLFRTKRDIQHEIIQNGPVISVSFRPDPLFFQTHSHQFHSFPAKHGGRQQQKPFPCHPVLILGWTVTHTGEQWKVQSLHDKNVVVHIGFGQWDIDTIIVAPSVATLEHLPLQTPGPYLDLHMPRVGPTNNQDWRDSQSLGISLTLYEMETLSHILTNTGTLEQGGQRDIFRSAITNQTPFVIRDKYRLAYSRRYTLQEVISSNSNNNKWKIVVVRFDAKHEQEPTSSRTYLVKQPRQQPNNPVEI